MIGQILPKKYFSYGRINLSGFDQVTKVVDRLLKEISDKLIVEESIPGEKFKSSRHTEFRLVFYSDLRHKYNLTGYYTKISGNSVSGNLSISGYAEELYTALADLVKRRFPKLTDLEIKQRTTDIASKLFERTELSIYGFIRKYREQAPQFNRTNEGTNKIAVDVIPVWNYEKNKFDWFFLELNGDHGDYKNWELRNPGMQRANLNSKLTC